MPQQFVILSLMEAIWEPNLEAICELQRVKWIPLALGRFATGCFLQTTSILIIILWFRLAVCGPDDGFEVWIWDVNTGRLETKVLLAL